MQQSTFSGIRACVFDAYGTLFDVHAPVDRLASDIGENAKQFSALWRQKQLEYSWLRTLMQSYSGFWQITCEALDYAMAQHGLEERKSLREDLLSLYRSLDAYADALPALEVLRGKGLKTAILSNGSKGMLDSAVESSGLAALLDDVISVDDIEIYKPHPKVYQYCCDRLGVSRPEEIFFVSSNTWDAQGASHFGLNVARVDRFNLPHDKIPGRPDAMVDSLTELSSLLDVA